MSKGEVEVPVTHFTSGEQAWEASRFMLLKYREICCDYHEYNLLADRPAAAASPNMFAKNADNLHGIL